MTTYSDDNLPFVYVALDARRQHDCFELARRVMEGQDQGGYGFKLNLDALLDFSMDASSPFVVVRGLMTYGKPVFVDIKMRNGARTMANIARGCADLGVDIVNMYADSGEKFIEKVVRAVEDTKTKVFCVTELTHSTEKDVRERYGCSLAERVSYLAGVARNGGAHGIILPPTCLDAPGIADLGILKLCPASRPAWYADTKANDQEQTATPTEAVLAGADYLVVGSPITTAADPAQALERILEEMREAAKKSSFVSDGSC